MFEEIALLGSEALKLLKKSASVIDSKLPHAHKESILTAQTKLHLSKHLDKYLNTCKTQWGLKTSAKGVNAQKQASFNETE